MAFYRNIRMAFWTDRKVEYEFTPEDKFFYLYLLTNPHTKLCGCYEIGLKQMAHETGYNTDTITRLLERFEKVHKVLVFCNETEEILLLNWPKYNWTNSETVRIAIKRESKDIKNELFRQLITKAAETEDTLSIPYPYGMDTRLVLFNKNNNSTLSKTELENLNITDEVNINSNSISNLEDGSRIHNLNNIKNKNIKKGPSPAEEIVDYLNRITGAHFRAGSKKTKQLIGARLNEGYTVDDFYTVIDKKYDEWKDTEFQRFLRPGTLFGSHFEDYLNQLTYKKKDLEAERRAFFADVADG